MVRRELLHPTCGGIALPRLYRKRVGTFFDHHPYTFRLYGGDARRVTRSRGLGRAGDEPRAGRPGRVMIREPDPCAYDPEGPRAPAAFSTFSPLTSSHREPEAVRSRGGPPGAPRDSIVPDRLGYSRGYSNGRSAPRGRPRRTLCVPAAQAKTHGGPRFSRTSADMKLSVASHALSVPPRHVRQTVCRDKSSSPLRQAHCGAGDSSGLG